MGHYMLPNALWIKVTMAIHRTPRRHDPQHRGCNHGVSTAHSVPQNASIPPKNHGRKPAAFGHSGDVGKFGVGKQDSTPRALETSSVSSSALAALLLRQFPGGVALIARGLLLGLEGRFTLRLLGEDTRGFFGRNSFRLRGGLLARRLRLLSDALPFALPRRSCPGNE